MSSRTTLPWVLAALTTLAACDVQRNPGTGVENPRRVASVTVTPPTVSLTVTLTVGQTVQFGATPRDADGSPLPERVVTWASSAPGVASVDGSGLVTGTGAGAATITATSEGQSGSAGITVVAPVTNPGTVTDLAVAGVTGNSLTLAFTEVNDGTGQPARYDFRYAVGTIAFGSATDVAQGTCVRPLNGTSIGVRRTCTILGLTPATGYQVQLASYRGTLDVDAVFGGLSNVASGTTAAVTVPVASVSVSPATASLTVGQTVQLTPTPKDANGSPLTGRTVTWASSAPGVASVDGSGLVTETGAGAATITATSEGQSGSAAITVTAPVTNPGTVTNLTVAGVTANSLTLSFTEVNDGTGQPARYDFRYAAGTISFGSALDVTQGTCVRPVNGTSIGVRRTCTILGLTPATGYQVQLASYRGTLDVDAVFGGLSNVASGTTTASTAPVATVTVSPASASVALAAVQQFTATLRDAGGNTLTGRTVTWSSSNPLTAGVSGLGLVTGLLTGTATITATSEGQSGSATLTVVPPGSGGVVFESNWSTAIGTSITAVRDGTRWGNYWEFNNGSGVQLISVVAGGPSGYANALRVLQRGSSPGYAAAVQQDNVLPPSTDYYVRFYMRNDDTSPSGDHIVTPDIYTYANLTYMRKTSGPTGWNFVMSMYGCEALYPFVHLGPTITLAHGVWYRFEYFVDFVDATHVQVHPRVYDANGTQILGDADFRQQDWGSATWNGRSDWTLASLYSAGYRFCVSPVSLQSFAMGNNGQAGSVDTGLPWFFAGVQIRTDRWPGP